MPSDLRTDWQRRNLGLIVTHPKVQEAADACSKMAKMIAARDALRPLVVLCGNSGCGKTSMLESMSHWAHSQSFSMWEQFGHAAPLSVCSVSWPTACDGFKEGFFGVIDDMMRAAFLCLDDIGAEHDPSRMGADKLCQVLSRREDKWTFVTTNISPIAWHNRFDERIADRLMRRSTVVDMSEVPSFSTL